MSGFGDLIGGVINGALAEAGSGSAGNAALITAVSTFINQHGGLSGLVQQFESAGLGGLIQSWIGNGQNLPISAEQVASVLGSGGALGQFAQQLGIDPATASTKLAELLPQIVDQLTPNGQIGEHNELGSLAMKLLGSSRLFG